MRNTTTRLLTSLSFFCLLAGSAYAGGIKHPSSYGNVGGGAGSIDFTPCSTPSTTVGPVVADCFIAPNGVNDFVFTISLVSPTTAVSITSTGFTFADVPDAIDLIEGDPSDCAAMSIVCTSPGISITNTPALTSPTEIDFAGLTGNLVATVYFEYSGNLPDNPPVFSADQTGATTTTPEPSELGILAAAFGCVVFARQKWQSRRTS